MDADWMVEQFEGSREHLRRVAYRMLGSPHEADDALQEAWLRIRRADTDSVENLQAWLTSVVARVCLDQLRTRRSRREDPPEEIGDQRRSTGLRAVNPEPELELADSIGPALLVVLETLGPAERVAFVLHDLFDVPFDEIAPIVGRNAEAARQLASRARRRVQGKDPGDDTDTSRQREVVEAFLAASRAGDFDRLLSLLDPEARLHADELVIQTAAATNWGGGAALVPETRGARAVAEALHKRARGIRPALIDGAPGGVWVHEGQVRSLFRFSMAVDKIGEIDLVMDPTRLAKATVQLEPEPAALTPPPKSA